MQKDKNWKLLIWLIGVFGTYFIWAFLDSIIKKENLFNALIKKLPYKIYHVKIPDFFVLIFFIIVFIFLFVIYKRPKEISGFKEKRKSKDFYFKNGAYWKRQKNGKPEGPFCPGCFDSKYTPIHMVPTTDSPHFRCTACKAVVKVKPKIESNEEYLFILDKIASHEHKSIPSDSIHKSYLIQFKNKKPSDLTILLNDLEKKCFFINEVRYPTAGIYYEITEDGLDYLKENKKP